jgi:hypothetical protein
MGRRTKLPDGTEEETEKCAACDARAPNAETIGKFRPATLAGWGTFLFPFPAADYPMTVKPKRLCPRCGARVERFIATLAMIQT